MVITVENRKGGVGKTTTAATLAVGIAKLAEENDESVLLIDLDPQGDAARALGIQPDDQCISHILTGEGAISDNIISADQSEWDGASRPNLYIIPASDRLKGAKQKLIAQIAVSNVMAGIGMEDAGVDAVPINDVLNERLAAVRDAFDYIIIDCPPTLDILQQSVHSFADGAVVPVKTDFHGTSATSRHTQDILDDQAKGIKIKILAVLPTFVRQRQNVTQEMLDSLKRAYGSLVSEPIPQTVKVEEAPASGGLTVLEHAPKSKASAAYWALINRLYKG